jgi:hypothetical protein
MKVVNRLVLAVSFMFASVANSAILSLTPNTQTALPGSSVSVTVMIDGLGDGVALSLSSYDIWIGFDTSVLSFTGYSLFDELGGVADADDFSWGDALDPNYVNIAEVSYLDFFDLNDYQPGGFALAELFFTVNPLAGRLTTELSIVDWYLEDAAGTPNEIGVTGLNNASIDVPAPAALTLMGLSLLTMFVRQKSESSAIKKS